MGDFGAFLKALAGRWLALVFGALVCLVAIGGYERANDTRVDPILYVVITVGVVLIEGGFLAFVSERHQRLALETPASNLTATAEPVSPVAPIAAEVAPPVDSSQLVDGLDLPELVEARAAVATPTAAAPTPSPAKPTGPGPRMFLGVTPRFLLELCAGKSPAEVDQLTAPYLEKWLEVTLILTQVQDYPPGNCIFVNGRTSGSSDDAGYSRPSAQDVACTFDRKAWLTHLQPRKSGDAIRVVGEVANIGNEGLRLIRCEIPTVAQAG